MKNQNGLTMIELLIAITISMMILAGVTEAYLVAQKNWRMQQLLSQLQDNGYLALHFLSQDIRAAGYIGCARLTDNLPLQNTTTAVLQRNNITVGYRGIGTQWIPALPQALSGVVKPGSDVITVRKVSADHGILLKAMTDANTLLIDNIQKFSAGDSVIINDCKHAAIFSLSQVTERFAEQVITTPIKLNILYAPPAEVSKLEVVHYFIGKTNRQDEHHQAIYALYRFAEGGRKMELVEGIDNMQVRYFEKTNSHWVMNSADQVSDWSQVKAVDITLQIQNKSWRTTVGLRNVA